MKEMQMLTVLKNQHCDYDYFTTGTLQDLYLRGSGNMLKNGFVIR